MAWFIIQSERKTWTKFLVEAENEENALASCDDWQYIGFVDGEDTDTKVVGNPFESKIEALADVVSFVEGL